MILNSRAILCLIQKTSGFRFIPETFQLQLHYKNKALDAFLEAESVYFKSMSKASY